MRVDEGHARLPFKLMTAGTAGTAGTVEHAGLVHSVNPGPTDGVEFQTTCSFYLVGKYMCKEDKVVSCLYCLSARSRHG